MRVDNIKLKSDRSHVTTVKVENNGERFIISTRNEFGIVFDQITLDKKDKRDKLVSIIDTADITRGEHELLGVSAGDTNTHILVTHNNLIVVDIYGNLTPYRWLKRSDIDIHRFVGIGSSHPLGGLVVLYKRTYDAVVANSAISAFIGEIQKMK